MFEKSSVKLVQTQYGYWTYEPKPSMEQLAEYYANKYFQQGKGSYAVSYIPEEIQYFRLKANLIYRQISRLRPGKVWNNFLDVGCGEGWVLDRMRRSQAKVKGLDFSSFGLMKFHPHLEKSFVQGNIFDLLEKEKQSGCRYDLIALANVIEHVLDPDKMLGLLKSILTRDGLLIVVAPNDFSALHEKLLKESYISEKFWLAYPDHLSYFNKDSMERFLGAKGFNMESIVSDNPIDLNLMNSNANYVKDRSKGKEAHYFRVRTDNFLASISEDKLLDIYTILGAMGVGRDLNYYCSLTK